MSFRSSASVPLVLLSSLGLGLGSGGCNLPTAGETDESITDTSATGSTSSGDIPTTEGPGGESSGSAGTSADSPKCGDGQIEGEEVCDGNALGDKTCADIDPKFTGGTLACAADCKGFDVSGCTDDPDAMVPVALNEVTSKGVSDGPYANMGDAIEIHNFGQTAIDLTGWKLAKDPTFPADTTFVFPPGSTLDTGAFLVLLERDSVTMQGHFPFGFDGDTETLLLADADAFVHDELTFDSAHAALSYCRVPDGLGTWVACEQTFGAKNLAFVDTCGDGVVQPGDECDGVDLGGKTCEALGFDGGALACTEFCTFDTADCIQNNDALVVLNEIESTDDRIEIYNSANVAVDISGWILTDDLTGDSYDPVIDLEKLVFPPMTSLAPKQFLVIPKGMGPLEHPFGLGLNGDSVSLLRANLTLVDNLVYTAEQAVMSVCLLPDGPDGVLTVGCMPTFGAPNKGP